MAEGTYTLMTYTGTASGSFATTNMPVGFKGTVNTGSGFVDLEVTALTPPAIRIAIADNDVNQNPTLRWITSEGATCTVLKSTNLLTGWWSPVLTGIVGTAGGTNVFTDTNAVERAAFYKIRIP